MANENKHSESTATKAIENQTAKIPSTVFLTAAVAAIGASIIFKMMKKTIMHFL